MTQSFPRKGVGYLLTHGYREDKEGCIWYPVWSIEREDSYRDGAEGHGYKSPDKLLDRAVEVSKMFPNELVKVTAFARVRLILKNGEITKEWMYEQHYLIEDMDDILSARIFDNLLNADSGELEYIVKQPE